MHMTFKKKKTIQHYKNKTVKQKNIFDNSTNAAYII